MTGQGAATRATGSYLLLSRVVHCLQSRTGLVMSAGSDAAGGGLLAMAMCAEVRGARAPRLRCSSTARPALRWHYVGGGEIVYRQACKLGCEGIVSKRLGSTYRAGRSKHSPPSVRREEEDWGR
jgi:hypothetical protein